MPRDQTGSDSCDVVASTDFYLESFSSNCAKLLNESEDGHSSESVSEKSETSQLSSLETSKQNDDEKEDIVYAQPCDAKTSNIDQEPIYQSLENLGTNASSKNMANLLTFLF